MSTKIKKDATRAKARSATHGGKQTPTPVRAKQPQQPRKVGKAKQPEAAPVMPPVATGEAMAASSEAAPTTESTQIDSSEVQPAAVDIEVTPNPEVATASEVLAIQVLPEASEEPAVEVPDLEVVEASQDEAEARSSEVEQQAAHTAPVATDQPPAVQSAQPATKGRQEAAQAPRRAKGELSGRYDQAAAEVGRLRREFLAALDEKAALLGVERVGEAVRHRSAAMEEMDAEIRAARDQLNSLLARKRELRGSSPELKEVSQRINRLRKERDAARHEKKAAYAEAIRGVEPPSSEPALDTGREGAGTG